MARTGMMSLILIHFNFAPGSSEAIDTCPIICFRLLSFAGHPFSQRITEREKKAMNDNRGADFLEEAVHAPLGSSGRDFIRH